MVCKFTAISTGKNASLLSISTEKATIPLPGGIACCINLTRWLVFHVPFTHWRSPRRAFRAIGDATPSPAGQIMKISAHQSKVALTGTTSRIDPLNERTPAIGIMVSSRSEGLFRLPPTPYSRCGEKEVITDRKNSAPGYRRKRPVTATKLHVWVIGQRAASNIDYWWSSSFKDPFGDAALRRLVLFRFGRFHINHAFGQGG